MSRIKRMFEHAYDVNVRPTKKQRIIQLTNNQKTPNSNVRKIDVLISEIDDMLGQ